jgi:hypothetical protein
MPRLREWLMLRPVVVDGFVPHQRAQPHREHVPQSSLVRLVMAAEGALGHT